MEAEFEDAGGTGYRDSLVVTHPTTNLPACGLSTAERTGSPVLHTLWSYVLELIEKESHASAYIAVQHCGPSENWVSTDLASRDLGGRASQWYSPKKSVESRNYI
ncbi:hypothetical protein N7462_009651 [Penicillium macrosclerotiorum]|uniref:uncharacterized protein n=1 Tax=Penicillium macrosclerotiorum TaxID=303699 RepID=UPI002549AACD|nr:uncharacterized protein N7462_009651 [Penicillium macrosclerotiorum]KAJ5674212.1 hypothetical protein N7462_009651 [Penicillium macrosclerotiorum]